MFRILKSTSLLLLVFISRGYAVGVTNLHVKTNLEAIFTAEMKKAFAISIISNSSL